VRVPADTSPAGRLSHIAFGYTDAATSLIAVYKALGGGWEMAPLPRYVRQTGTKDFHSAPPPSDIGCHRFPVIQPAPPRVRFPDSG
jgi:hypothetical protein